MIDRGCISLAVSAKSESVVSLGCFPSVKTVRGTTS
jgi:hypothetical protein